MVSRESASPRKKPCSTAICSLNGYATLSARDGWISFARFMQTALYEPGLGYYSGGSRKFGPGGDFITAPPN